MQSEKSWTIEAVVRLFLGVIICTFAGSVISGAVSFFGSAGHADARVFLVLAAGSVGFLGGALAVIRRPWPIVGFTRRFSALLVCLYLGLTLGGFLQYYVGDAAADSKWRMVIATLSFQGAALAMIWRLLRERQMRWAEAFGFAVRWRRALLFGVLTACPLFLCGCVLQWVSAEFMTHFQITPVEQQAVQTLRTTNSLWNWFALGATAILLAPVAEEMLFRGILYPAVKHIGFPRLALWGTAVIFAAWHQNLATFVPLLLLSIVLTFLYEKTDNLLAPIAAHSFFNIMNFAWLCLEQRQHG